LKRTHKRAFTLIELLVVIAIIAILAAILFPVFAQAKMAAKKAVDISNLKNLTLAGILYTSDYDDMYTLGASCIQTKASGWCADDEFITWRETTYPYIKNGLGSGLTAGRLGTTPYEWGGIFATPAAPQYGRSYEAHGSLFQVPDYWGWCWISGCSKNANGDYESPTATSATILRHPASTLMLTTQGIETDSVKGSYVGDPSGNGINDASWAYHGETGTPQFTNPDWPGFDADMSTAQAQSLYGSGNGWYAWLSNTQPRYRYNGTANFSFADGHAKSVKKGTQVYCQYLTLPELGHNYQGGLNSTDFNVGGQCANETQYQ